MNVLLVFGLLIFGLSIGLPIGIAVGSATLITMAATTNIQLGTIAQNCFAGLDSFPLMAIPFFILAGNLMRYGGVSKRILDFAGSLVRYFTGGLAMVTTLACMFFAAISGSAPATVTAIGSFMMPAMEEKKYDIGYAAAITASAGSIGVIIPPSIPFVIYGVVSGASVGDMFMAGIIPGVLMGVALMVANYIMSKKLGYVGEEGRISLKEVIHSFKDTVLALLMPVIILGGIYGGIFTPTESAVVGVVYALFVGKFIYHEINGKTLFEALRDTVLINGATSFVLGLSTSFAGYLAMAQVPATIANFFMSISDNKIIILLLMNLFLLLIGCFIDNISATIILTPILLPVVLALGMGPVHFGIMLTINLAIGFVTPPYGVNLFFASAVANVSVERISKFIIPFIAALLIVLLLVTFVEPVSMLIPNLLR